jgi:hypothetical protein
MKPQMKRRDFNRMALGVGLSPLLATRSMVRGAVAAYASAAAKVQ